MSAVSSVMFGTTETDLTRRASFVRIHQATPLRLTAPAIYAVSLPDNRSRVLCTTSHRLTPESSVKKRGRRRSCLTSALRSVRSASRSVKGVQRTLSQRQSRLRLKSPKAIAKLSTSPSYELGGEVCSSCIPQRPATRRPSISSNLEQHSRPRLSLS